MRLSIVKFSVLGALVAVLCLVNSLVTAAEDGPRAPPVARTAGTLSGPVLRVILSVQELMSPEEGEPDFAGAKEELDQLYERRFERMSAYEKATTLSFYTTYYLSTDRIPEAIEVFEQILSLEELAEAARQRSLLSLGQLYLAEERFEESIQAYQLWREYSLEESALVFQGLTYAHYQLDQFSEALPHWLSHLDMVRQSGERLMRDKYVLLNNLYLGMEDYENAKEVTKTMLMLFNEPDDWRYLTAIYANLDDEDRRIRILNIAHLLGYIGREPEFLNLSQSLGGIGIPYNGAKVLYTGMDLEIVNEDEETLKALIQLHMLANNFDLAIAPASTLAEMAITGDGFDTLGYIHYVLHDYNSAVAAFEQAIEKGNLSDTPDTLLFLSRALLELDQFEEAIAAAKESADAGNEAARQTAERFLKYIESSQSRAVQISSKKQEVIDFYLDYPKLQ
jgi:tetratricopeptide (TPR) repeat protein